MKTVAFETNEALRDELVGGSSEVEAEPGAVAVGGDASAVVSLQKRSLFIFLGTRLRFFRN